MRWGDVFPPVYVNALYHAVQDHLDGPFRFICFTDDAEGIDPDIDCRPIPDLGLPPRAWARGAWPKIGVLAREAFDFEGRALFIDLDTFILDDLAPFFEGTGFRAIAASSWTRLPRPKSAILRWLKGGLRALKRSLKGAPKPEARPAVAEIPPNNMGTGIFAFDIGAHVEIAEALVADIDRALALYINEQHFIQCHLDGWTPWPDRTICSLKYDLRQPVLLSPFRHPENPGNRAPILAFHGDPRPLDMIENRISSAREFPHMWIGKVRWVHAYWQKYAR